MLEQPYNILYKHSFGEVSKYFKGLHEHKLMCTMCRNKEIHKNEILFLPPMADCPECMREIDEWIEVQDLDIRIYTFTNMYFAGESFLDKLPLTLINIDVQGFDKSYSKLISILVTDEKGEINIDKKDARIGMMIKPKFKDVPLEKVDASTLYLYC